MIVDNGRRLAAAPLVYQRIVAPVGVPVSRARACKHLRIDALDLDEIEGDLVDGAIAAAVEHLDGRTGILGRALLTQTWQATTDRPERNALGSMPGFVLDLPPVQAVTKVERRVGNLYQEVAAGDWESFALPEERLAVVAAGGLSWPAADLHPAAWRITFRTGYGAAGDAVPAPILSAILLMVSDLYDNRDGKIAANMVDNPTVDRLLDTFRKHRV